MDNGQMARWVARLEHIERMEAEKRDAPFWRDIRPDDLDMRVTDRAVSNTIQPAGGVLSFFKKRLASLGVRPETRQKSELERTEVYIVKPFGDR